MAAARRDAITLLDEREKFLKQEILVAVLPILELM